MNDVPDAAQAALRLAAEAVTVEYFALVDTGDLASATALYAEDAVFLGARGRAEIGQAMRRGLAVNAGLRSRHVIGNVRSTVLDAGTVVVDYTAVAYTLGEPPAVRSVLDQQQLLRRDPEGILRTAEHRIPGYAGP